MLADRLLLLSMKLYLSSYHLGTRAKEFAAMFTSNKKIALISNALDYSTDEVRKAKSAQRELDELQSIGLQPKELDLRQYFGQSEKLNQDILEFGGIWMRGGNSFVLRRALAQSGLDLTLQGMKSSDFICAGYSAGACVLSPSLKGIHLADEPEVVPEGYQEEIIWDGLDFIPYSIAPHYGSDHPEASLIEKSIQYFIENKMLFIALKDGEDIIYDVD